MQKASTGTLEKPKTPELTKLADISIDKDNKIFVNWPVDKKELVIVGLAEAIKLVETYKSNTIVQLKPNFIDFIKGRKP